MSLRRSSGMRATRIWRQRPMQPPSLAAGRYSAASTYWNPSGGHGHGGGPSAVRASVHSLLWPSASRLRGPDSGSGSRSPVLSPARAGFRSRLSRGELRAPPLVVPGPSLSTLRRERGHSALSSRSLCSTPLGRRGDAGSRLLGDFSAVGTGVRICRRARTERRNRTGR